MSKLQSKAFGVFVGGRMVQLYEGDGVPQSNGYVWTHALGWVQHYVVYAVHEVMPGVWRKWPNQ